MEPERMEKKKKLRLTKPVVGEEEIEIVREVLKSGWLAEGSMTREFEKRVAEFTGAKYAVATTSCTTAMELALRAAHIGPGDEVIVPDFTYPATADVVSWVGANPVLVDVDISSYNVNPAEVEKAISEKTRCIIPVSWGGNPIDMEALDALKQKHDLLIIEDAACSLGSEFAGRRTGAMADITCFSFHARKVITTGEGGMITTNNEEFCNEIRSLKRFGLEPKGKGEEFVRIGTNYKLNDILGAIGIKQMEKIDNIIERRIELANNYNKLLKETDFVRTPAKHERAKHVYQTYAVYLEIKGIRDRIIRDLSKENIETQIGTYALHLQKAFSKSRRIGRLSVATKLYRNLLTLPMCHSMTLADQERVAKQIERTISRYSLRTLNRQRKK
jgi:dTDP-4-amino-4,6-dideoxygalactose transaminase